MLAPSAAHGAKMLSSRAPFRCPSTCVVRRCPARSRRSYLPIKAIGFDFGDRDTAVPPRNSSRFSNLGTLAASLLVLAPVLKGAVAEAFLGCLAATKKYQASNKDVLAAYTKFYGMLLAAGYDSWQDYLLDQLLMGRDNPLARVIAQGTLDEGAPILTALMHDLDVLQALAISLPELVDYVSEMAPFAGSEWMAAASTISIKRPPKHLPSGKPVMALALDRTTQFITRPPTTEELALWKGAITSKEHWGQAASVLVQYWHLHGFGITSRNTALRWVKGALDEAPDPLSGANSSSNSTISSAPTAAGIANLGPLSVLEPLRAQLAANTVRHCEGAPGAQHVLVAGPSGTGKTWLLWDSTLAAGRDRGLRVVDVGSADAATILEAARGCARYPRIRFVLVADHLDMPLRGTQAADMMQALTTAGPGGWPSNTLLYVGVTPTSTINLDPVVTRFGLTLITKSLDEAQFGTTLKELAERHFKSETVEELPADKLQEAVSWAKSVTGGLTVRSAAQYLTKYVVP